MSYHNLGANETYVAAYVAKYGPVVIGPWDPNGRRGATGMMVGRKGELDYGVWHTCGTTESNRVKGAKRLFSVCRPQRRRESA